jgi:Domain of unknown function (DUF4406)
MNKKKKDEAKKLKIYVSGPMTGYKNYNYPKFQRITSELKAQGFDVVDPATDVAPMLAGGKEVTIQELHKMIDNGEVTEKEAWRCFLRGDIVEIMINCNAIYLLKNHKASKGARFEKTCMSRMGYPEFYEGCPETDLLK